MAPWARWFVGAAGLAGAGLFAYLIVSLGPRHVVEQLAGLGTVLPTVLLVTGLKYPLQTAGWRLALPRTARPPWSESIGATITGDALGYLTWAGPVTGEPVRALLLRRSGPIAAAVAAGAVERGMYNFTAFVLVLMSALMFIETLRHALIVSVVVIGTIVVSGLSLKAVRRNRIGQAAIHVDSTAARPARTNAFAQFLGAVRDLWRERRGVLTAIAALCVAQHVLLIWEAYLLLRVHAEETTFATAVVFEAATKIVNTAGAIVPGRLGVSEGGSALLAGTLGFSASQGFSLALMRRVRALIWAGVGLVILPLQEARARRRT